MDPQTESHDKTNVNPKAKEKNETEDIGQVNLGEIHVGRTTLSPETQRKINKVHEMQSKTCKAHSGSVPPGSEAACAQSELDKELAHINGKRYT